MQTLQIITSAAEFAKLEGEWNALAKACPTPMHRFEWFDACRRVDDKQTELQVFVARVAGKARAIAPLIIDRSGPIAIIRMLGHFLHEVSGFPCDDEGAAAAIWRAVFDQGLPLRLQPMRTDSHEVRSLVALPRPAGLLYVRPIGATPSAPLHTSWDEFEARMSKRSRGDIRRIRKIAEREGGAIKFETALPDETTVDKYLDEFFLLEASGWKGRAGTAILNDARMHRFCTTFGRIAARLGMLRMLFLRIGDATAAARMNFEYDNRLWDFKIAYDERWASCSPGILLMHETLRYAVERRLDAYEFLGTAAPWQHRWPIDLRPINSVRFYPLSSSGGVLLGYDAVRYTWSLISGWNLRRPRRQNAVAV
jgi:CelD/BcsL family acetyltransferase involved in cellulose biosynthesis